MLWILLALAGAAVWLIILLLPWRPWAAAETLNVEPEAPKTDLSEITVLIPARNESEVIQTTLEGLKGQGEGLSVVLVDDQSTDDTVRLAEESGIEGLKVIPGTPPPPGWSGKLWALQQGCRTVETPLTLLIDADIYLEPGALSTLLKEMKEKGVQFLSLMAALRMDSFWERLLMPAFIYFFKLLYPFRLSNNPRTRVAAAAGGCILLETRIISELGGFDALRGALIDDCALAKRVKSRGYRTWIGLTRSVRSLRSYDRLRTIWNMVARTAFVQLRHSGLLLLLCTLLMAVLFLVPVAGLLFPSLWARVLSLSAIGLMILTYLPTLAFYGLPRRWSAGLPLIGALFLAMTWTSAVRHWLGEGAEWKGRSYVAKGEFQ